MHGFRKSSRAGDKKKKTNSHNQRTLFQELLVSASPLGHYAMRWATCHNNRSGASHCREPNNVSAVCEVVVPSRERQSVLEKSVAELPRNIHEGNSHSANFLRSSESSFRPAWSVRFAKNPLGWHGGNFDVVP